MVQTQNLAIPPGEEDQRENEKMTLHCTMVVPCHNEEEAILGCLDALSAAALPEGATWERWIVLDDASTDGTVSLLVDWAARHPSVPLTIAESGERLGKALELEAVRSHLADAGDSSVVMVVGDADCLVEPGALAMLLRPFALDPTLGVAWGTSTPGGARRRRLASRFQMTLAEELARGTGPGTIRAEGRLFAIRPSVLEGFRWEGGFIADDTQLAAYVQGHSVRSLSVTGARTFALPVASYRDFYLQTYRAYAAERLIATRSRVEVSEPVSQIQKGWLGVRALFGATRREPLGLPAYAFARGVAAVRNRFAPVPFTDCWVSSQSSKQAGKLGGSD